MAVPFPSEATERFVRDQVAHVDSRLDDMRDMLREQRADMKAVDAKLDELTEAIWELRAKTSAHAPSTGTALGTKGVAAMSTGLAAVVATVIEVAKLLIKD